LNEDEQAPLGEPDLRAIFEILLNRVCMPLWSVTNIAYHFQVWNN
jgi:hypothetical protein